MGTSRQYKIKTLENITCPCCFSSYKISELLIRTPGASDKLESPNRFTTHGFPRSANGQEAQFYVCPKCAFDIPLRFLLHPSIYISLVGAPAAGKTQFTVAMYREMVKLETTYKIHFTRADIRTEDTMNYYYRQMYDTYREYVNLEKTPENDVKHYNNGFPRPYTFEIQPLHTASEGTVRHETFDEGVFLNIYDQAGEDWDKTDTMNAKFGHLRHSNGVIFVIFDPCKRSLDSRLPPWELVTLLKERAQRTNPKVLVLVSKLDLWVGELQKQLLKNRVSMPSELARLIRPRQSDVKTEFLEFDKVVSDVSQSVRDTLYNSQANENDFKRFLNALDDLSADVTFFPISSTGVAPTQTTNAGELLFERQKLCPRWVDMPLIYVFKHNRYTQKYFQCNDIEMEEQGN